MLTGNVRIRNIPFSLYLTRFLISYRMKEEKSQKIGA